MQHIITVLLFVIAAALTSPVITNNKETSNELYKNDPVKNPEDAYLENITAVIKNEEALEYPILKSEKRSINDSGSEFEGRKKNKIKKIKKGLKKVFIPILILILIKAVILIPLALAILAFKTFNSLNLALISFATGLGLTVWKFCTNLYQDKPLPVVHGVHPGWELDRNDNSQLLAYSSYVPQ